MAGNRFAITLVGNLAPFYNFIMFLAYFLRILFQKQVGRFISRQHGTVQALGPLHPPRYLEEDEAFFLQCEAKIVRRHTCRQRSGVV